MKKLLALKTVSILMLLLNMEGLYHYSFSDKWMFLYDNARLLYFTAAIVGICMLFVGVDKKSKKGFLLTGLFASLPLVFFTFIYTINTYRHGMFTLLFMTTVIWLVLFYYSYKTDIEVNNV